MRLKDWVNRYVAFVHGLRNQQFVFGVHDCCITACNEILTITGVDPGADFRGNYGIDNPIKALKLIKDYGDVDIIAEQVCDKYGWPEVSPGFANRCDLVCIDAGGGRKALGWLDLDATRIYTSAIIGLQDRPRKDILRAWRIE